MPSLLSWVDHDPAARERSLRILALFQERETRDELGLGSIRDSFSDQLFPGTSTIQTRLKYMLFVPWVYQELERERRAGESFSKLARYRELELVRPLLESDDRAGLFGVSAGKELKRLPSSVYWAGMKLWGIRRFEGSIDEYHRSIDSIYRRRESLSQRDDGEWEQDPASETWHPKLPAPSEGYPNKLGFSLSSEEAQFLLDRIVSTQCDSLLAHMFLNCEPAECDFPWEHPEWSRFSKEHHELLTHARLFSETMQGAAIIYNIALAQIDQREELLESRLQDLNQWRESMEPAEVANWSLPRLWELTVDKGHNISWRTRDFVTQWVDLLKSRLLSLEIDSDVANLIRERERKLKQKQSRFENSRARDQWKGKAGMNRLNYRWPTAKSFHRDLFHGLNGA